MATLTYFMITSADGYITSPDGSFDWSAPTPANHAHANALTSGYSGEIYGPRLWETMKVWEDIRPGDGQDYGELAQAMYAFAETWRAMPHYVFNRREGKPLTKEALRELKSASGGELSIGGARLAALALEWGEVDEVARYLVPHATGGGTPWWPLGIERELTLTHHEELDAGWLYLRYRVG